MGVDMYLLKVDVFLRYEYGGCVYAAFVLSFLNYFLVLFMICAQVPGHRCLNICGDLDNLEAAENAEVSSQALLNDASKALW